MTHVKNGIIIDIGGTTTDVAALVQGFPRQSSSYSVIAGIRTNLRMPDTFSVALGGGSIVKFTEDGSCIIGP